MGQRQIQINELTPKLVREALKKGDRIVVFDGGEPIALVTGAAGELQRHKDYFVHYPHPAAECFNTCWRHNGSAEQDQAPVEEPVPANA